MKHSIQKSVRDLCYQDHRSRPKSRSWQQ